MDQKKIKALLEKYYKGESTLGEEKVLREYFSGNTVDPEFMPDKDMFLYQVHEMGESEKLPDISNEIWDSLTKEDYYKEKKNNKLVYISLRIAASIMILVSSYFIIKNQVINGGDNVMVVDTFNDPELAYKQAKETLLYVSAMLNNGTEHLEPVHKINEETQKLNAISRFNKGLEELKPIEQYNKADKYFKQ